MLARRITIIITTIRAVVAAIADIIIVDIIIDGIITVGHVTVVIIGVAAIGKRIDTKTKAARNCGPLFFKSPNESNRLYFGARAAPVRFPK